MVVNRIMNKLITIYTYDSVHTANLAKSALQAEGVRAFLKDEFITQVRNYGNVSIGVKLQVPEFDAKRALELLEVYGYANKSVNNENAFLKKLDLLTKKIPIIGELFFELRLVAIVGIIVLGIVIPIVLTT